jgi:hypothetical protein
MATKIREKISVKCPECNAKINAPNQECPFCGYLIDESDILWTYIPKSKTNTVLAKLSAFNLV